MVPNRREFARKSDVACRKDQWISDLRDKLLELTTSLTSGDEEHEIEEPGAEKANLSSFVQSNISSRVPTPGVSLCSAGGTEMDSEVELGWGWAGEQEGDEWELICSTGCSSEMTLVELDSDNVVSEPEVTN